MTDMNWLANQAHQIHDIFTSLFYGLVTVLLCLGIFIEYFKWPLGGIPSFSVLVGRALVSAILLHTYPEVTNTLGDIADAVSRRLGDLNEFKLVLSKMGDHLGTLTWSWSSVRETVTMVLSFVTFFLLFFSVHVVEAFLLYSWTLLYVFSPILIALFVLPATSAATKSLYRSLIEVSCWKIVWSVLATLLWSAALSDINKEGHDINFITAISFNLILAGSLLLTPMVVHALAGAGITSMAQSVGAIAVGATMISPRKAAVAMTDGFGKTRSAASSASEFMKNRSFSKSKAGQWANNHNRKAAPQSKYSSKDPSGKFFR